ncbi:hypothetical protein ACJX0J_021357, partial [Zea mays]
MQVITFKVCHFDILFLLIATVEAIGGNKWLNRYFITENKFNLDYFIMSTLNIAYYYVACVFFFKMSGFYYLIIFFKKIILLLHVKISNHYGPKFYMAQGCCCILCSIFGS